MRLGSPRRRHRRGTAVAAPPGNSAQPKCAIATRTFHGRLGANSMSNITPFLMFNDQLESALEFYTATFPGSEIIHVARSGEDGPLRSAEFVVGGQSPQEGHQPNAAGSMIPSGCHGRLCRADSWS